MSQIALSILDAAKAAGVGRTTIAAALKTGRLRARKCGARTLITEQELEAWVASLPQHKGSVGHDQ